MTRQTTIFTLAMVLLAGMPADADTCDGACGGQSDGSCFCDLNCAWFGDCCDDLCDFCAEVYPLACGLPCEPVLTCEELGLTCGKIVDCWWVPDFCGTCGEGDYCDAGTCVLNPCDEPSDIPGCFGICEQGTWLADTNCNTKFNCEEMNWDGGDCEPCTPDCGEQTCGLDPVCGILCGVCGEGTACTEEGACEACGCGEAVCGIGPVCGEDCGTCEDDLICEDGLCVECQPDCAAVECGPDPICGDECGPCLGNLVCEEGLCVECQPDCTGLVCGPDPVCGDECGPCADGLICENGLCFECEPDCTDLECGLDPICDEECGPCEDGFHCDEGTCTEDPPDCVGVCVGHCGDSGPCDCGGCEEGFECLDSSCAPIAVGDVVTSADSTDTDLDSAVPDGDVSDTGDTAGNDAADGAIKGGDGGSGCSTTRSSGPLSVLSVLFALLALVTIRFRNVLVDVYNLAI